MKIVELKSMMNRYHDIYIFGAGKIGRGVIKFLSDHNLKSRITGIVVSDLAGNDCSVEEIKVTELNGMNRNALVIISVSALYGDEIERLLKNKGFHNHLWATEFIKNCVEQENLLTESITMDVREIFIQQNGESPNRLDAVVRYLAIENYYGINNYGFTLYEKMQGERVSCYYANTSVNKFKKLIASWEKTGYDHSSEISLDRNLHLIDGSHRLALALYHGIEYLNCCVTETNEKYIFDELWFSEHGFRSEEIIKIKRKYKEIIEKCYVPFQCVLWPPVYQYFDEITNDLEDRYEVTNQKDINFADKTLKKAIMGIYHIDDVAKWKIEKKISILKEYYPQTIRILSIQLKNPQFRLKQNGKTISIEGEKIKKRFREIYQSKVENYFYDIIIHTGDNFKQNEYIFKLFEQPLSLVEYFKEIQDYEWIMVKSDVDYFPENFPEELPFSHDIDIICRQEQFSNICAKSITFCKKNVRKEFEIDIIEKINRLQIRIEREGFLVFLIDIFEACNGISNKFLDESIKRRVRKGQYWIADLEDELCFRIYEYIKNRSKIWHLNYIKKNYCNLNIEILNQAFADDNELLQRVKELLNLIRTEDL